MFWAQPTTRDYITAEEEEGEGEVEEEETEERGGGGGEREGEEEEGEEREGEKKKDWLTDWSLTQKTKILDRGLVLQLIQFCLR